MTRPNRIDLMVFLAKWRREIGLAFAQGGDLAEHYRGVWTGLGVVTSAIAAAEVTGRPTAAVIADLQTWRDVTLPIVAFPARADGLWTALNAGIAQLDRIDRQGGAR